jgi:hypothetical protein
MQRDFDFLGEFATNKRSISLGGSRNVELNKVELFRKRDKEKRERQQQRQQERAASIVKVRSG